jgi:hypothetical protein
MNLPLIIDDIIGEFNESIEVTISSLNEHTVLGTDIHTYTILDNEPTPILGFTVDADSVDEGITAYDIGLTMIGLWDLNVTVDYTVRPVTAAGLGVDYSLRSGTTTIYSHQDTTSIPVTISEDMIDENNEVFQVVLSNSQYALLGSDSVFTFTILDNDVEPSVAFSISSSEGDESTDANIQLTLSEVSGRNVAAGYTIDGPADDYMMPSGTAIIAAGQTTTSITTLIIDDELDENDETIVFTLSGADNASLGLISEHTYTILDNDAAPSVWITAMKNAHEDASAPIPVYLTASSGRDVTVGYSAITGGTATSGTDYNLPPDTVVFRAGVTRRDIPIDIVDDGDYELGETILIEISDLVNAQLGDNTLCTYTINDNDGEAKIQFVIDNSTVDESTPSHTLQIELVGENGDRVTASDTVKASYGAVGGTAEEAQDKDYYLSSGLVAIPPGSSVRDILLNFNNDLLYEGDETLTIELSSPVSANLGSNTSHTVTILDNELPPLLEFTAGSSEADESTIATFPVSITPVAAVDITFEYAVTGGTAVGGGVDYLLASGSKRIIAGESSLSEQISATIYGDNLFENVEFFEISLFNVVNAGLDTDSVHTCSIISGDLAPQIEFVEPNSSGTEGDITQVNLIMELSGPAGVDVSVDYNTSGSSAVMGVDYLLEDGPITIPAGQTSANLILSLLDDDLYEQNEEVVITLVEPDNATLLEGGNNTYTYILLSDDSSPDIQFVGSATSLQEDDGETGLTVSLSAASGMDVLLFYEVDGITATNGDDYVSGNGADTIRAGEISTVIPLTVIDDEWDEEYEEVLKISLTAAVNAELGDTIEHTFTILDNDDPPSVSFVTAVDTIDEGGVSANIQIRLSRPSHRPISVDYELTGDASGIGNYADYYLGNSLETTTANFIVGDSTLTLTVTIFEDLFYEGDETVEISLTNLVNTVPGTYSSYTLTLLDNDSPPSVFQLSSVYTEGGNIVPGYWNASNLGVDVLVPIDEDSSLISGTLQLQAKVNAGAYKYVGASQTILAQNLGTEMAIHLEAYEFEGFSADFNDGAGITLSAIITDVVGNSTTSTNGTTTIIVDQTPPVQPQLSTIIATGGNSVSGYWNMTNTGVIVEADIIYDMEVDTTLVGGRVTFQAEADGTFKPLGSSIAIQSSDLEAGIVNTSVADSVAGDIMGIEELNGFSDGALLAFRAVMSDAAGNSRTGNPAQQQLVVDESTPHAALSYSAGVAREGDAVTVTATFDETGVSAPRMVITYPARTDSGDMVPTSNPAVWDYTATIPAGNDGIANIDLMASDHAGNVLLSDDITGRSLLTVDNTPSNYTLEFSDEVVRAGDLQIITATFQDIIQPTPMISIDFSGIGEDIVEQVMSQTGSELIWTYILTTPPITEGVAAVTITAGDQAGNPSIAVPGTPSAFNVDNEPPSVDIVSPDWDAFTRKAVASYNLSENTAGGQITWTSEQNLGVFDPDSPHTRTLTGEELQMGNHTASLDSATELVHGAIYTVEISVLDGAGNTGSSSIGGVTIDALPPAIDAAIVNDGVGRDIDTTRSTTALDANYSGFVDDVSGITLYEYAIGTSAGGNELIDWTPNGVNTSVSVTDLELFYKQMYYVSVRATDLVGNLSAAVSSNGVVIVDKPRLTTSVVQNSLLSAFAQIFIVDSLGMADSVQLLVNESQVSLNMLDPFVYATDYDFASTGSHALSVTGYSGSGDTTLTYGVQLTLAKRSKSWNVTSSDGQFRASGTAGSVMQDYYLMVVDSLLITAAKPLGRVYRLADEALFFDKPVRVSMYPGDSDKLAKGDHAQAVYILRSNDRWEELPTVDDGDVITTWSDQAGIFRLGPRTIIVPVMTTLNQNYPNPFNPSTMVTFDLGFLDGPSQRASVKIYNLLGQEVRTLYNGEARMGHYELLWRGIDQRGVPVASGIYFVRLMTDSGFHATKKMLLVR